MARIEMSLNGDIVSVDDPAAHMTLLDFSRARGLTGAKEGCGEGECGACVVAVVEPFDGAQGARAPCAEYRVINTCLALLPMAAAAFADEPSVPLVTFNSPATPERIFFALKRVCAGRAALK